jgi:hypothetical protein
LCNVELLLMKKLLVVLLINYSDQRYNLGEVGRYRMNKKLV